MDNKRLIDFQERCMEAREKILTFSKPVIVHHYDCDGLSSAAIVSMFLDSNSIEHDFFCVRKLDARTVDQIMNKGSEFIFVDLGSGSREVNRVGRNTVIIDHHQPVDGLGVLQVNPMHFGFDGASEASAATTAYFVCNVGVHIGIVGAVGDMQYPFKGLNRLMLEKGIEQRAVIVEEDLLLYGKATRTLPDMLCYSSEPYLPGLTGDYGLCVALVKKALGEEGLKMTYYNLTTEEKKRFVSELVKTILEQGYPLLTERLFGESYKFVDYPENSMLYDVHEFSTLVNACGRNDRPDLGIAICKNQSGSYEQGVELLELHRKKLKESIEYALNNQVEFDNFYFIDGREIIPDSVIGVVCGMLNLKDKPVIGISYDVQGMIKASGRGTSRLVQKGLDLGKVMRKAGELLNGNGGGHNIAAGCTFPRDKLNGFLKIINEEIARQLESN